MSTKILLSDGLPLVVSRTLVSQVGLEQALVLQQVHYWLNPKRSQNFFQEKYWVHNTYQQWQNQFSFWSVKKIQRVFSTLETHGFLLSITRYNNCYKKKFYTINYEKFGHEGSFPNPLSQNGSATTPNLSHGEGKRERRSGQKGTPKSDHFETESKEFRGLRSKGKNGCIVIPKVGDEQDRIEVIDDPKNGLSYKLITEITNKENPPLTPPYKRLAASQQEEEEKKSKKAKIAQTPETILFQQMVDAWNAVVQGQLNENEAALTTRRVQKFAVFLQETPISDLTSWERYCKKIARSRFLKGENASGFRVTLDWALKAENAQKILEGAIYDKQAPETQASEEKFVEKSWAEYAVLLKRHCEENDYSDRWFRACLDLAYRLGQATFENWFKGIVPQEVSETLILETGNAFIRDYINTHYESALQKAIQAGFSSRTCFEMRVGVDPPETEQALPSPTRQSGRQRPEAMSSR